MRSKEDFLRDICSGNVKLRPDNAARVLILFKESDGFIGDTCLRFDKLKFARRFFPGATIQISFDNSPFQTMYLALLRNSPDIDEILPQRWAELNFSSFDVVIAITSEEEALMETLLEKCSGSPSLPAVFSLSRIVLNPRQPISVLFPVYDELLATTNSAHVPAWHELAISDEEKAWADDWLRANGLFSGEDLVIMVDSSSSKKKLLPLDVHFNMIKYFIGQGQTRLLVYDEHGIGKQQFYREWLGESAASRIIFAHRLGLRKDISLLAATRTRIIFGPCTGLLHCASGIYNRYVRGGLAKEMVPLIVAYTGKYSDNAQTAEFWWANSPLVECLVLRETAGKPSISRLSEMTAAERRDTTALLPCKFYTSQLLKDFIANRRLQRPTLLGS